MTAYEPLSARLNAAFDGCYEAHRASALSGVPQSTVYLWARNGLVTPSVSPARVKLWSYADLMALRIVYWLRHPKFEIEGRVPASPMPRVREALAELEQLGMDIWDDSGGRLTSPLRVDASGKIWVDVEGIPHQAGQAAMLESLDLLGPFDVADRRGTRSHPSPPEPAHRSGSGVRRATPRRVAHHDPVRRRSLREHRRLPGDRRPLPGFRRGGVQGCRRVREFIGCVMQLPLDHNFPEPGDSAPQHGSLRGESQYLVSIPPRRPGFAGPGGAISWPCPELPR